ncbi:MAG: hypothetical protein COX41_03460 [Candidatus Omnitrophica bacterium CG23_combo_of_CG06-09_8_20_14_all_41_10]|uniref:UPF0235 protein COX41_03460 n=1 Tax=Candidatus Sherwoodlollariibacterium unditelluris TaxID=1974757 RepID=A0A2G9YJE1_9BACT|nr:MAG: hypothetical protein COX41_03460 [Candidatus Omnitrophica bacterium CG23_combo_of_CG06-09_8_20_14_all_41_10]
MKIFVKVKPSSKVERVTKVSENEFILSVKAPAKEGRANEALVRLLSEYFDMPKSRITILKGLTSRDKIIELLC